ncbi:MAG: PorV/PorQ family protein, partial [Spirochaetes bacterium]|nr:PorV/PorQ family protein [Spirochaetota bacterium]
MLPLVFLLFTAFSFAETGGVDNIFSFGVGLRALGMGGAFIAMDNDPTLAYWNPGAMAFNQYKEISLFGTRTIADTYYFAGFYTNPTTNLGTLGIGAIGIYTNGIESYDENASPITGADTNYVHYQILLSYGYNFRWGSELEGGLGLGATAKIEQIKITDYKGTGASFDVGAYYNPTRLPWLSLGLVVQDVYGTGIKLDEEFEKNTRIYKAGLATNFLLTENKKIRLSFALDSRFYTDNYNPNPGGFLYDFSFGTELAFSETLMIRAGYNNFSPQYINFPVGISVGLGVRLFQKSRKEGRERGGFGIDYAVTFEDSEWQGPAELLMRIGLSYRFGKSMDEKKKDREEEILVLIDTAIADLNEQHGADIADLNAQHEADIADLNAQH